MDNLLRVESNSYIPHEVWAVLHVVPPASLVSVGNIVAQLRGLVTSQVRSDMKSGQLFT